MRYYLFIYTIVAVLLTNKLYAQQYEKDKKFINEIFKPKGKMVICNHLDRYTIDEIKDEFKYDTLHSWRYYYRGDSDVLILNNNEIEYIYRQLKKMQKPYLKADLFDSTLIISERRLKKSFKGNVDIGWAKFYKKYSPNGYYNFSKPIFLRNDSLCIFYYGNHCGGLCGGGGLYVYKKTENGWKSWIELFRWVS